MTEKKASATHWGDWLAARAREVGFLRQRDLAVAVGCTEDRLSHWVQLSKPPKRMLKGFDESLAKALATTKQTLFVDYVKISPKEASEQFLREGQKTVRKALANDPSMPTPIRQAHEIMDWALGISRRLIAGEPVSDRELQTLVKMGEVVGHQPLPGAPELEAFRKTTAMAVATVRPHVSGESKSSSPMDQVINQTNSPPKRATRRKAKGS